MARPTNRTLKASWCDVTEPSLYSLGRRANLATLATQVYKCMRNYLWLIK